MELSRAMLQKMAEAKVAKGGNHVRHGRYVFAIRNVKIDQMQSGLTGVVEMLVLKSEAIPGGEDAPNPVGDKPSVVCQFDQMPQVAWGNFNAPLAAALDEDPESPAFIAEMGKFADGARKLSEFRGVQVRAETYIGVNKGRRNPANQGKPIIKINWFPVEQSTDDIVKMRAYLDSQERGSSVAT